jgi:hypothetical protein
MAQLNYSQIETAIHYEHAFDGSSASARVDPFLVDGGRLDQNEWEKLKAADVRYVVFSYPTPVGWITTDGKRYVVQQSFSRTTNRIQAILRRAWGVA